MRKLLHLLVVHQQKREFTTIQILYRNSHRKMQENRKEYACDKIQNPGIQQRNPNLLPQMIHCRHLSTMPTGQISEECKKGLGVWTRRLPYW